MPRSTQPKPADEPASVKTKPTKPQAEKPITEKPATDKSPRPKLISPKAAPRPENTRPTPPPAPPPAERLSKLWSDITDNFNQDILGLLIIGLGGAALFSALLREPAWIERMMGWTAPFYALALLVLGIVMLWRGHLGYWSAEALIGGELLLLSLQVGTYVINNDLPHWPVQISGVQGGAVGWALGSLLVSGFGQTISLLFLAIMGFSGLLLLARYTPLIYLTAQISTAFPFLVTIWQIVTERIIGWLPAPSDPSPQQAETTPRTYPAPRTRSFVDAKPKIVAQASEEDNQTTSWDEAGRAKGEKPARRPVSPLTGAVKTDPTKKSSPPVKPLRKPGELPAIDLLRVDDDKETSADISAMQDLIVNTLEDFNVPVKVVHIESGPTVTQFGVEPLFLERAGQKRKIRVSRIVGLADDLALALAAPAVRIEAPVPGRPYVGIEVPNPEKMMVGLRGILESQVMRKEGGFLGLPLGRNTAGQPVVMDLVRAPHMLIAGSTGSGKSVCINTIVAGLLMQHGPETLRFVMVDPKMVELVGYNEIPHLMGKVITEVDQVMGALTWLLLQMDDRYRTFREVGVRNVLAYNDLVRKQRKGDTKLTLLPYIVLIIDELADLMMTAAEDIERQICRLAQMARATGIHLILATQRPSVDVVTGLIKANFPTRIAFAVTSQTDSRVILDTPGAERLLGRGDMLMMRSDSPSLQRIQGCYVADEEINGVVGYWKGQTGEIAMPSVPPWNSLLDKEEDEEELIHDAIDALRGLKTCSTSLLQRKLQLGYPRAARLMEELASRGIVGADQGAGRGREVLLKKTEEEVENDEA